MLKKEKFHLRRIKEKGIKGQKKVERLN